MSRRFPVLGRDQTPIVHVAKKDIEASSYKTKQSPSVVYFVVKIIFFHSLVSFDFNYDCYTTFTFTSGAGKIRKKKPRLSYY